MRPDQLIPVLPVLLGFLQGANKRHERKLRELEAGDHATYITRANVVVRFDRLLQIP